MGKRYLFTPIGLTDPIKYQYDGSMLHICRKYKPDYVYLYLSKETLQHHHEDNRYVKSIELLGKHLNHKFEVHVIEREELIEVQDYDFFYPEFSNCIKDIRKKMNKDDELIVNIASGTPGMKSALLLLSALNEYNILPVRVDSPQKKSNSEYEERANYDVILNWESNMDNLDDYQNRCAESRCLNLADELKKNIIRKMITVYDYEAALSIALDMTSVSEEVVELLKIAQARYNLDRKTVSKLNRDNKYDIYPVKEGDKQKIFEYALVLQIKMFKGEYADFIRAITPIVVDLYECILKYKFNIDINDYCSINKKKVRRWDERKLQNTDILSSLKTEWNDFRFGDISSIALKAIIRCQSDDYVLIDRIDEMSNVEQKVRNMAAHEIISITDEYIKDKTGKEAKGIMNLLKYLIGQAGINVEKAKWNSYNQMNEMMLKLL